MTDGIRAGTVYRGRAVADAVPWIMVAAGITAYAAGAWHLGWNAAYGALVMCVPLYAAAMFSVLREGGTVNAACALAVSGAASMALALVYMLS